MLRQYENNIRNGSVKGHCLITEYRVSVIQHDCKNNAIYFHTVYCVRLILFVSPGGG